MQMAWAPGRPGLTGVWLVDGRVRPADRMPACMRIGTNGQDQDRDHPVRREHQRPELNTRGHVIDDKRKCSKVLYV